MIGFKLKKNGCFLALFLEKKHGVVDWHFDLKIIPLMK